MKIVNKDIIYTHVAIFDTHDLEFRKNKYAIKKEEEYIQIYEEYKIDWPGRKDVYHIRGRKKLLGYFIENKGFYDVVNCRFYQLNEMLNLEVIAKNDYIEIPKVLAKKRKK